MKQTILILLLACLGSELSAQRAPNDLKSPEYYLDKGRNQRLAGSVLLGTGIVVTTVGVLNWALSSALQAIPVQQENRSWVGAVTAVAGIGAIIGGASLLKAGRRNIQRATDIDLYLERLPITGMASQPSGVVIPAVRIRVAF